MQCTTRICTQFAISNDIHMAEKCHYHLCALHSTIYALGRQSMPWFVIFDMASDSCGRKRAFHWHWNENKCPGVLWNRTHVCVWVWVRRTSTTTGSGWKVHTHTKVIVASSSRFLPYIYIDIVVAFCWCSCWYYCWLCAFSHLILLRDVNNIFIWTFHSLFLFGCCCHFARARCLPFRTSVFSIDSAQIHVPCVSVCICLRKAKMARAEQTGNHTGRLTSEHSLQARAPLCQLDTFARIAHDRASPPSSASGNFL